MLQINFVDHRPIPKNAKLLTDSQCSIIISHLLNSNDLDGLKIEEAIQDKNLDTLIGVMRRLKGINFFQADGLHPGYMKDSSSAIHALKKLSIDNYITVGSTACCLSVYQDC